MPRRGIVNVKMVITEEKILSNIEKVQRLINPNSKKQIVELEDNAYFKDLVESIKTYLVEYPRKKNFPKSVYDASLGLVEYSTKEFEENTKQIEQLIKQREYNIKSAAILKQTLALVESKAPGYADTVASVSNRFSEDVIQALDIIGTADQNSQDYQAAKKLLHAKINNLQSNLHIEIDMERVEDRSKALSYIGIEIADALKLIPAPDSNQASNIQTNAQNVNQSQVQNAANANNVAQNINTQIMANNNSYQNNQVRQKQYANNSNIQNVQNNNSQNNVNMAQNVNQNMMQNGQNTQMRNPNLGGMVGYNNQNNAQNQNFNPINVVNNNQAGKNNPNTNVIIERPETKEELSRAYQDYYLETRRDVKPRLWEKFKNSKFVKAIKYILKIRIVLKLPEGTEDDTNRNNYY